MRIIAQYCNSVCVGAIDDVLSDKTLFVEDISSFDASTNLCFKDVDIKGTESNDNYIGTPHDDVILGGAGADTIYGGEGSDKIYSGKDSDAFVVYEGDATGNGHDNFIIAGGNNTVKSNKDDDAYNIVNGANTITAGIDVSSKKSISKLNGSDIKSADIDKLANEIAKWVFSQNTAEMSFGSASDLLANGTDEQKATLIGMYQTFANDGYHYDENHYPAA